MILLGFQLSVSLHVTKQTYRLHSILNLKILQIREEKIQEQKTPVEFELTTPR